MLPAFLSCCLNRDPRLRGSEHRAVSGRAKPKSAKCPLFLFLLLVTVACRAQDTNGITSKIFERDRDKDGKPDVRIETVYRGDKKVMLIWSKPNAQGVMTVTSRSYIAGGDLVSTESDEDGDGIFETIAVYRSGTSDMEVFTRQRDGSVKPVSARTLAVHKRQHAAISEFWDKAFDKGTDIDKAMEMMRETQQKIRDAEKEKTDGKK